MFWRELSEGALCAGLSNRALDSLYAHFGAMSTKSDSALRSPHFERVIYAHQVMRSLIRSPPRWRIAYHRTTGGGSFRAENSILPARKSLAKATARSLSIGKMRSAKS